MTKKFRVGDVVALKSGGPKMTVVRYESDAVNSPPAVLCVWFPNFGAWAARVETQVLDEDTEAS